MQLIFVLSLAVGLVPGSMSFFPFSSSESGNYSILCEPSKLYHCQCPPDDTSTTVDCSKKEISSLPENLKFPTHITVVTFSRNRLTIVPSNVFSEGLKVEQLDLSHNHINTLPGNAFANLNSLTTLDLSYNRIWSLSTVTFAGLNNLAKLNLANNALGDIFPEVFHGCSGLKELSLKYNYISFLNKDFLSQLSELNILDLSGCELSVLPENVFAKNTKLSVLWLSTNLFPTVPTKGLQSAPGLKSLDLSENPIESIPSGAFSDLNQLEVLIMTHMSKLGSVDPHSFAGLYWLKTLILTDNLNLSKISEAAFRKQPKPTKAGSNADVSEEDDDDKKSLGHPSLEKFLLRHNALKTLPEGLLDWGKLKEVDLRENPWQCDCHMAWIASELSDQILSDAKCSSPSRVAGQSLSKLSETDYTCHYLTSEATIALSILVVAAFVLALGGISYLLYRRNLISCRRRRSTEPKYARVVAKNEKVDLEWDHTAEPESRA